jgi:flavodoxin
MKTLIIYYSLEGNTRLIADTLAQELDADTLRLEPIKDIKPNGFMKYMRGGKQIVMKETPKLRFVVSLFEREMSEGQRDLEVNPNDYDLIIMGTPVRAFNYVPAFRTFFQDCKIKNKQIALFCTHEGQAAKTLNNMKDRLPQNDIIATKAFINVTKNKKEAVEEAKKWSKELA